MVSPFEIYIVLQLDTLIKTAGIVTATCILITAFSLFIGTVGCEIAHYDSDEDKEAKKTISSKALQISRRAFGVGCIMAVVATVLPSTKSAAAMFIIPAIVNNEQVQKEAGELYTLAKDALKEAIKPD